MIAMCIPEIAVMWRVPERLNLSLRSSEKASLSPSTIASRKELSGTGRTPRIFSRALFLKEMSFSLKKGGLSPFFSISGKKEVWYTPLVLK